MPSTPPRERSGRPRPRLRPRPAGRHAQDRREAILRAAIHTFAQRGFFNAQVADVARAAGVAAGTVYLYFANKDDLLVSIFDRTMEHWIDRGRQALQAIPDPVGRLDEIARIHLHAMGRDRELAVVFQVELRQSLKFMEQFSATRLREYLGIIRDVIADGQSQGVFRDGLKPTIAAKMFFGILDAMATNWVVSHRPYPLEAEAALAVDLFVTGLAPRIQVPPPVAPAALPRRAKASATQERKGRGRRDAFPRP